MKILCGYSEVCALANVASIVRMPAMMCLSLISVVFMKLLLTASKIVEFGFRLQIYEIN